MPRLLSAEDCLHVGSRLAEYITTTGLKRCAVVFHGGEPLLMGAPALANLANTLRLQVGSHADLDIGLQTNGLLLTSSALDTLEKASITVSLSLDGPKVANDLHRTTRRGRSSYDKVVAALKLLKARPSVFEGVIAVIDPRSRPRDLLEFFSSAGVPSVDFLLPDAHHLKPPPGRITSPRLYQDWLIEAFDLWLDNFSHLPVRTFESLLDAAAGLPSTTDGFGFGDVSLITIETDGSYHDLDVLKIVGDGATRLFGTVRDTPIASIASSPQLAAHRALLTKDGLCERCKVCEVVDICGGGSLPHRYGLDGYNQPTVYCKEMLALIGHIKARLSADLRPVALEAELPRPAWLDIGTYELAEQAEPIVRILWNEAQLANKNGFINALDTLGQQDPSAAQLQREFTRRNKDQQAEISSRPGAVAWQRTVLGQAARRSMLAIDGTELVADAAYLKFLLASPRLELSASSAGMMDSWLRAPFGKAIHFEPEATVERARPVISEALDIIRLWRPSLYLEMQTICHSLQLVRDPLAHPEKIVSFSDNTVPGALYVSIVQGTQLVDPYDLADSLIHEHRHQKLYLLERMVPVVLPTVVKVRSPWRDDLRPPSGLLHAVFVFVELRRFWLHVREAGPEHMKARAEEQLRDTDANLREAFATLETCPLTSTGIALAHTLRNASSTSALKH